MKTIIESSNVSASVYENQSVFKQKFLYVNLKDYTQKSKWVKIAMIIEKIKTRHRL